MPQNMEHFVLALETSASRTGHLYGELLPRSHFRKCALIDVAVPDLSTIHMQLQRVVYTATTAVRDTHGRLDEDSFVLLPSVVHAVLHPAWVTAGAYLFYVSVVLFMYSKFLMLFLKPGDGMETIHLGPFEDDGLVCGKF